MPPSRRPFWEETRYDRRFWVWAYLLLALVAVPLALAEEGSSAVLRWLIVVLFGANAAYKAWKWRREGRWSSAPTTEPPAP